MFQPTQLKLARQSRGLTRKSLAGRLEISDRTLARWEKGDVEPTAELVDRMAEELQYPPGFFSQEPLSEIPSGSVSFRAVSKMTARERDMSYALASHATSVIRKIEESYRIPPVDVPSFSDYDPELAAQALRAYWMVDSPNIVNITHLAESHGVRVFSIPRRLDSVDAFSFIYEGTPIVMCATWKSAERRRFDMAHELGHLVMHRGMEAPLGRDAEAEANLFASAFLMPRDDILATPLRNASPNDVIRWKQRWGVSALALTRRLRDLGMLTEWGYRESCIVLSREGYRLSEPNSSLVPEKSLMIEKIIHHSRGKGRRISDLARSVNLQDGDFTDLIFGLATVALPGSGRSANGPRGELKLVQG